MTYAPITAGAVGIVYWAHWRSSDEAMESLILPEMKRLSAFTPYLLGTWRDTEVSCTGDRRTAEYLKQYDLPNCSYCVREAADGSVLLLAVNNTKEPRTFTFFFAPRLRNRAIEERFSEKTLAPARRHLTEAFGPFETKAYIFAPMAAGAG